MVMVLHTSDGNLGAISYLPKPTKSRFNLRAVISSGVACSQTPLGKCASCQFCCSQKSSPPNKIILHETMVCV